MGTREQVLAARAERDHRLVVVGGSLGGVQALRVVLASLDANVSQPVAVVLHRHPRSTERLARTLQQRTTLEVREVEDKQLLGPGVFLAPSDYHLLVERDCFSLSLDAPVCHARPSVDVLFESAADAFGPEVVAVVLSGANRDGASGVAAIRARGGVIVVQDPEQAEAPAMPRAAVLAGAQLVLALSEIGGVLTELLQGPPS